MKIVIAALTILSVSAAWWEPLFRPSNPRQLTSGGIHSWQKGDASAARRHFAAAAAVDDAPVHMFNAGTAALSEGALDDGARLIDAAIRDDAAFAADGLFNEGTALLREQRLDDAVARLQESLRRDPSRQDAKRNLELALMRREDQNSGGGGQQSQPQDGSEGQPGREGEEGEQESADTPPEGTEEGQREPGQLDAEAVLRAVAQQEAEELKRMREARTRTADRGTGW